MNKISKFVVGVTLFLFLGQSFASLKMSCDLPDNSSTLPETSAQTISSVQTTHSFDHRLAHESRAHTPESSLTLQQVSLDPVCDEDQHSCFCAMGSCATSFLPAGHVLVINPSIADYNPVSDVYSSRPLAILFRPPISA